MSNSKRPKAKDQAESYEKTGDKDLDSESKVSKTPKNLFQNDGSFMEMFKMMQGQQSQPVPTSSSPAVASVEGQGESAKVEAESKRETEAPCYATQTICYKDGAGGDQKPQYQVIIFTQLVRP